MIHASESRLLFVISLLLVVFVWAVPAAWAEGQTPTPTLPNSSAPGVSKAAAEPLYTNYRGVSIGMSVEEVRGKLGKPESKGTRQDFFVISKQESAQVFYLTGKVSAVSVDYVGVESGAPTPMDVFGAEVTPMKNGRVYKMARYPKAGYWVSYNRTAGQTPTVSITMRKIR